MAFSRRSHRSQETGWSLHDTNSLDTMYVSNSESSTSSSARARARDTGFPESFCGNRNTSRPHPDADTSPNASISQEDIAVSRAVSRNRRSFLASKNKNRRTIMSGRITPEMERMYSSDAVASDSDAYSPVVPQAAQPSASRCRADSIRSASSTAGGDGVGHEDAAPAAPGLGRHARHDSMASTGRSRRPSFLAKLGFRKPQD